MCACNTYATANHSTFAKLCRIWEACHPPDLCVRFHNPPPLTKTQHNLGEMYVLCALQTGNTCTLCSLKNDGAERPSESSCPCYATGHLAPACPEADCSSAQCKPPVPPAVHMKCLQNLVNNIIVSWPLTYNYAVRGQGEPMPCFPGIIILFVTPIINMFLFISLHGSSFCTSN